MLFIKSKSNLRRAAFTLTEILIAVAILGLLAAMAVPHFIRQRALSQRNVCISNLRQIAAAKAVWAQERNKSNSHTPQAGELFGATNYLREWPRCPSTTNAYIIREVGAKPECTVAPHLDHVLVQ